MATKKTEPKKAAPKKSKDVATYKGEKYRILDRTEAKVKLTDGIIHFWVNISDVEI